MRMFRAFIVLIVLLPVTKAPSQSITEFAICKQVEELQPIRITNHYKPGERAYAWMNIEGAQVGTQIMIDWYAEDQLTHTSKLTISTEPTMRTYAYKTLYTKGVWKVIVRTRDNTILKEANITVGDDSK